MDVDIHIPSIRQIVGQDFTLPDFEQARLTLTAVEVREDSDRLENFSLIFSGPPEPFLRQATYRLFHNNFGDVEIFLVPFARTDHGYQYEAVFNLIRKPSD